MFGHARLPKVALMGMFAAIGFAAHGAVLHDNGTVFDAPGAGFGGADLSRLIAPNTVYGFRTFSTLSVPNRHCDDLPLFTDAAVVQQVQVFVHSDPGEAPVLPTLTIDFRTGNSVAPSLASLSSNLSAVPASVTQIGYRALSTDPLNADRKVYRITYNVTPFQIQPATKYWIAMLWTGTTASTVNVPKNLPVVPTNGGGNAVAISSTGVISQLNDPTSVRNVELAFKLIGEVGNRISGTVALQDWKAGLSGNKVEISIIKNGSVVDTVRPTLDAGGHFEAVTAITGSCDIRIKRTHWLSRKFTNKTLGLNTTGLSVSLINGDCDQSDYVGTDDYLMLNTSFDLNAGDAGFLPGADLDGDDYVGTDDYLILNKNFDLSGE